MLDALDGGGTIPRTKGVCGLTCYIIASQRKESLLFDLHKNSDGVFGTLTRPASEFRLTRSWILKLFGTVVRSDAAEKLQSRQFSY